MRILFGPPRTKTPQRLDAACFLGVAAVIVAAAVLFPSTGASWSTLSSPATDSVTFTPIDASLEDDIDYLLSLVTSDEKRFDLRRVDELLNFVASDRKKGTYLRPKRRFGADGTFHQSDVHSSLSRIAAYSYNPEFPSSITRPTSLRLSGWRPGNGISEGLRKLQSDPDNGDDYVLVRGVEYMEITPDRTTGGYYSYDMDRVLIRTTHNGHPVLLSIGKQRKPSSPGKKGLVIGDDDQWNYFYSGLKGISMRGLGWANTYVYDSVTLAIYYELDPDAPITRNAVFSWLKGGWCTINVVCTDHIYEGVKRSILGFKEVIESPRLPAPDRLARVAKKIRSLSTKELKEILRPYAHALEQLMNSDPKLSRDGFSDVVQRDGYLEVLSREELESLAILEYLKHEMGKSSLVLFKPSLLQ